MQTEPYDPALTSLIDHLYDAAIDDTLWAGTAGKLAAAFDSTSAVLKLHGQGAQVDMLECTGNLIVPADRQEWALDWHRRDLWVHRSVAYGMSRIIWDELLSTPEEQKHSDFYQDWLRYLDIFHVVGAVFPAADGAIGVLGVHRPKDGSSYDARERHRAALLLPHLQRALKLGQRLQSGASAGMAALAALDRLDAGVLVVDDLGQVRFASQGAEQILASNTELTLTGGRLCAARPALHARMLGIIKDTLRTAAGRIAPPARALAIPRAGRLPLTIELAPLRPSAGELSGERPAALLFLRDPESRLSLGRLAELFGLTRAEAVVASALSRGASLEDMAQQQGVSITTVRSHLKRILAKTGTHRQAELVALLARSLSIRAGED